MMEPVQDPNPSGGGGANSRMNSRSGKLLIALCIPLICWLVGGYVLKLGFIPILRIMSG
jgi:hypothetical protein